MSNELGIDDSLLNGLLEITSSRSVLAPNSDDLPEGSRQILIVSDHNIVSAGYISGGNTNSQSVIILTGQPSPSSDPVLKVAYIMFVPDGDAIRTPQYTKLAGRIDIWVHQRNLQTILTQIHEGNVFCWIGHFANNHIYADIHSSH